jgi:hypothetical protein
MMVTIGGLISTRLAAPDLLRLTLVGYALPWLATPYLGWLRLTLVGYALSLCADHQKYNPQRKKTTVVQYLSVLLL